MENKMWMLKTSASYHELSYILDTTFSKQDLDRAYQRLTEMSFREAEQKGELKPVMTDAQWKAYLKKHNLPDGKEILRKIR